MTSKLGCQWMREHPDQQDLPHIEAMQYKSVKLFKPAWDNADFCRDLLTVLPKDSYILARDHALSEQKSDIDNNAVGAGIDHAQQWINKVKNGEYHLPLDRTFFLGINEPNADSGDRNAIDLYTESFLRRLAENGLRGGAFNFSTGHPRTVDGTPNTLADYSVFERSHRAIVEGHHIGVLHIYGTGAVPCAPGHYDRLKACTWQDVEWVVGEMAVDSYVIGGGEHNGFHVYFDGRLNDYCPWLDTLIMGINDSRIHSYQVFTYDFAHPWSEFDIHPIRPALESYQWQHMVHAPTFPTPTTPPVITRLPDISNSTPTTPMFVNAIKGANLREAASTKAAIIEGIPYAEQVNSFGMEIVDGAAWNHVITNNGKQGWIFGAILSPTAPPATKPVEPPVTPPSGDNWSRILAFLHKWEGGFQDVDWDAGNWTGCEVGKGEKKGTNHGVSACAYPNLDIRNLSQQAADDIFFRDYWRKSGADEQPWPLCLFAMNAAVNFGVGIAQRWIDQAKGDELLFYVLMLKGYRHSDVWPQAGDAWVDRMIDLAEAA